jgi:ubiquitin-protein ligase
MSALNDEYKEKLSIITNNPLRKRLTRELIGLDNNEFYLMDLNQNAITNQHHNYFKYSINLYEMSTNRIYEIILSDNYPFAPPKLNINSKPYSYYYKPSYNKYNELLLKYKKIRCLCCQTMLCGDNWSPAFTVSNIIKEVHDFENYFKEISHRIIIDVIKRKYLISDINLLEWLY